jgi:fibronectin-binding autotransporter adhesin
MSFLQSRGYIRACSCVLSLMVVFGFAALAPAATFTWDGGATPDTNILTAANWVDDVAPPNIVSTTGTDDLVFTGTSNVNVMNGLDNLHTFYHSATFDANAGVFTFTPNPDNLTRAIVFGTTSLGALTNNSSQTQTFYSNVGSVYGDFTLNAASGDFLFRGQWNIGWGSSSASPARTLTITGPHDVYFTPAGAGSAYGLYSGTSSDTSSGGHVIKTGTGTLFLNGDSYRSGGAFSNGKFTINQGAIRIASNHSLGQGYADSTTSGRTTIGSTASDTGRLELTGNIDCSERLFPKGRTVTDIATATVPHIVNISGANTLSGPMENWTSGQSFMIDSNGTGVTDSLTISGTITNKGTASTRDLAFRGGGNGTISGSIINGTGGTWNVYKYGGGKWTITGSGNNYTGNTIVGAGTLGVSGAGTIATSPLIDVKSGATFNVSGASGWTLAPTTPQTLIGSGTVIGGVQAGTSATISGGTVGTVGKLEFSDNLNLNGGGTLQFDLNHSNAAANNDQLTIGGNLTLSGSTTVNVNSLDILNGLTPNVPYVLMAYTGTLTGDASNLGITSSGTTRQTYAITTPIAPKQVILTATGAPLSLTWKGTGSTSVWDVVGAANWNNNTQKFYNADVVTFDNTPLASPNVTLTGNLAPAVLTVNNSDWDYTFSGSGAIVGATGLTKFGTRKLIVANDIANDFTGAIAVKGGTLEVGAGLYSGTLGTGAITLDPGTTLAYNLILDQTLSNTLSGAGTLEQKGAAILTVNGDGAAFSGPVKVSAGTLKLTSNLGTGTGLSDITVSTDLLFGGTANWTSSRRIVGPGTIKKLDANTVVLTANNTNTGITTVDDGTLSVGNGGADGALGPGDIAVIGNGRLTFNRAGIYTVANVISGYGLGINYSSAAGVVTVSGNSVYDCPTVISDGVVKPTHLNAFGTINSGTTIGPATTADWTQAATWASKASLSLSGGITLDEPFTLSGKDCNGVDINYTPHIVNQSGDNTLNGAITINPTAANYYQFNLRSEAGKLTLANSTPIDFNIADGKHALILSGAGNGAIASPLAGAVNITKTGSGVWTFSGANSMSGVITINAGTVAVADSGSFNSATAFVLNDSLATLDVSGVTGGSFALTTQALAGVGKVKGNITSAGSASISPSYSGTYRGGTMTIQGNYTCSGAETFAFNLTADDASSRNDKINVIKYADNTGGGLIVGAVNPLISILSETTLKDGGTYTLMSAANLSESGGIFTLADTKTRYQPGLSLETDTTNGLLKLHVSGTNKSLTWTGASAANWNVIADYNWQAAAPNDEQFYQADDVTFNITATGSVNLAETVRPASIAVNVADGQVFTMSTTGTGNIAGGTGLTKTGDGQLTLSTKNTFNGEMRIEAGKVVLGVTLGSGSEIGQTAIVGGTLDMNGHLFRIEPLSVQGAGVGGNGALINNGVFNDVQFVTLTGDATFGGSGAYNITQTSAAEGVTPSYLHGNHHALTKVGANSISLIDLGDTGLGDVNVNAGNLTVQGNTTLGYADKAVNLGGGTLTLNTTAPSSYDKGLNVGVGNGAINNAAGNNTLSSALPGVLDGTLTTTVATGTTFTLAESLSGLGGLTKSSAGTLVIARDNSYQGDTLLGAGTLKLGANADITLSEIKTVANTLFQIDDGTSHVLAKVSGTGTMSVSAASTSVTAISIQQTTLSVGTAPGAAAVPEPGTWTLLLVGLLAMASWHRLRNR